MGFVVIVFEVSVTTVAVAITNDPAALIPPLRILYFIQWLSQGFRLGRHQGFFYSPE